MTRRCAIVASLLAGALLVSPRAAARAQGAAYQPGIDVLDYDVRLELPDTGAFLRGDVTVTARRDPGVRELRLDLVRTLAVRAVRVNGVAVAVRHVGDAVLVALPDGGSDTVRARVRYDGVVADGLIAQHDAAGRWTWFGDNWPDRARQWLPTVDHPSDKATVSFTVRAPTGRTVVSNGTLLGVTAPGGSTTGISETRWREAHPIPTYLMVIGVGALARTGLDDGGCLATTLHRCPPQAVYTLPSGSRWMPGPFAAAPAIVAYFESLVGPFPYEKLAHLQSATRFGGMENASAIFYADQLFARHTLGEGIIAHETAHQWFGDAVTEREWGHLWLSEGFATYFAALWTRHAHGEEAFDREMARIRTEILADSVVASRPVLDTAQRDYLRLLNANSYQKGGYILYLLNEQLGDSVFHTGLRAYYAAHRDGNALSLDLQRAMETASGRPLGEFFDQWLTRPGVPELTVGWAYDASAGTVSVAVSQLGASSPYAIRLPVSVVSTDGEVSTYTATVSAHVRDIIQLPHQFTARPMAVRIDPDDRVLGRLRRL